MLFDVVYSGIEGGLKQSERIGSHSRFNILQDTLRVGDVTMFTLNDEREEASSGLEPTQQYATPVKPQKILTHLNSKHPTIKFELERLDDSGFLPILDTQI